MAAFTSYDVVGKREDISDIITNISPTKTPFTTLTGQESVHNTVYGTHSRQYCADIGNTRRPSVAHIMPSEKVRRVARQQCFSSCSIFFAAMSSKILPNVVGIYWGSISGTDLPQNSVAGSSSRDNPRPIHIFRLSGSIFRRSDILRLLYHK